MSLTHVKVIAQPPNAGAAISAAGQSVPKEMAGRVAHSTCAGRYWQAVFSGTKSPLYA